MLEEAVKFGFARTATRDAAGTASFNRLRRLALSSGLFSVTPVTFPPGRVRVATRPTANGSETAAKTIGMVVVAFLAASDNQRRIVGRHGHPIGECDAIRNLPSRRA